jgi:hypothetical protein
MDPLERKNYERRQEGGKMEKLCRTRTFLSKRNRRPKVHTIRTLNANQTFNNQNTTMTQFSTITV